MLAEPYSAARPRKSAPPPLAATGALLFTLVAAAPPLANAQRVVFEDFSQDDLKDVARTSADWNTIEERLKFPSAASLTGPLLVSSSAVDATDLETTRAVAVGDLDGDGFPDLVFGNNGTNSVYFNDGFGTFVRGGIIPDDPGGNTRSAVIEDFDGDGYLDVLFAEFLSTQESRIHFNNGSGSQQVFSQNDFVLLGSPSFKGDCAAAGDVDGDGDIDVVLAIHGGYVKLFRNNGSGTFAAPQDIVDSAVPELSYNVRTVLLGDLDRDGDLDLVSAREYDTTRIHLNDGAGNFSPNPQSAGVNAVNSLSAPNSVSMGDVNGDGWLDLFVGNDGSASSPSPRANYLFINSGNAADFFPALSSGYTDNDLTNTNGSIMLDIDRDGDLDVVLADFATGDGIVDVPGPNKLYLNDGAGNFPSNGTAVTTEMKVTKSLAHGDFDRDGDLDLVFVNQPGVGSTQENSLVPNVGVANGVARNQLTAAAQSLTSAVAVPAGGVLVDPVVSGGLSTDSTFRYWLSDDGGLTWITASPRRLVTFPSPVGNDFRWRVEMTTQSPAVRPALDSLLIATEPNNPPLVIAPTADGTFDQGESVTLDAGAAFDDPDGDALTFAAAGLPASLAIDPANGVITGTLNNDDVLAGPVYAIVVTADDGVGGTVEDRFDITVIDVNDAPVFTSTPVTAATEGQAFDYAITTTDPDGDTLLITAPVLPGWLTLTDNGDGTATLSGAPTGTEAGDHVVQLQVSDGIAAPVDQGFVVTVTLAPDRPVISLVGPASIDIGLGDVYNDPGATASDPQDGDLTADIVVDNPVDTAIAGSYTVTYTVSDSAGLVAQATRTVNVVEGSPGNTAPSFTSAAVTTAVAGSRFVYAIATSDAEMDAVAITAPTKPSWLTISDNGDGTARLEGTPGTSDVGANAVVLRAMDPGGLLTEQAFTITVSAAPPPPGNGGGGGGGSVSLLGLAVMLLMKIAWIFRRPARRAI